MRDLLEVYIVYACGAMAVVILGSAWDTVTYERKTETVECSYRIVEMARKLNVTIVDKCEVDR